MDANDWLKMVEKKLQVMQCNNREKVLLASHQLLGPAYDWWDAYEEAHEAAESINCYEFKMAFRFHHVPQGVMKLKKKKIPRSEARIHDGEQVCHSFHASFPLCSQRCGHRREEVRVFSQWIE
jgi:hypothetical protein